MSTEGRRMTTYDAKWLKRVVKQLMVQNDLSETECDHKETLYVYMSHCRTAGNDISIFLDVQHVELLTIKLTLTLMTEETQGSITNPNK